MFAVLEDEQVDSAVREHACETHAETAIVGQQLALRPHFASGLCDELVAVQSAFDGLALHSAKNISRHMSLVGWTYNLRVSSG